MLHLKDSIINRKPKILNHRPPIIGATCAFDARIYKNVDVIFYCKCLPEKGKKNFKLFYFCSALTSLLVDFYENLAYFNAIFGSWFG